MRRRSFVFSSLAAGAVSSEALALPPNSPRAWFELRFFHLRNDFERPRLHTLLKDVYLTASKRLRLGPMGFFIVSVGPSMPMLIGLTSYSSLAAMEAAMDQLAADSAWTKTKEEFSRPREPAYERMESRLSRAIRLHAGHRGAPVRSGTSGACLSFVLMNPAT